MAAEAEAAREARAKVIAAEGEQKAARALREASEVIGDSPAALQLRYLQVSRPLLASSLLIMVINQHNQLLHRPSTPSQRKRIPQSCSRCLSTFSRIS